MAAEGYEPWWELWERGDVRRAIAQVPHLQISRDGEDTGPTTTWKCSLDWHDDVLMLVPRRLWGEVEPGELYPKSGTARSRVRDCLLTPMLLLSVPLLLPCIALQDAAGQYDNARVDRLWLPCRMTTLLPFALLAPPAFLCIFAGEQARASCSKPEVVAAAASAVQVGAFDARTEKALRNYGSAESVARLRMRACSWDGASKSLIVGAPRADTADKVLRLGSAPGFPRLRVTDGSVVISVCQDVLNLPSGLEFFEDLVLVVEGRTRPVDLPAHLHVRGNLLVQGAQTLPPLRNVVVDGDMGVRAVRGDAAPLELSGTWSVGGSLDLMNWPVDAELKGEVLRCNVLLRASRTTCAWQQLREVFGDLDLRECPNVAELPATLREVHGNLLLDDCHALQRLPPGLHVHGDLSLRNCLKLEALPENLTVDGSLLASECVKLANVPASVRVGGDELDLSDCEALFTLPPEALGSRPRGARRLLVNIAGSSIVGAHLVALRAAECDRLQIFFQEPAERARRDNDTESLAAVAREFGVRTSRLEAHIDPAYVRGVIEFLTLLLDSAEYHDETLRRGLKARVAELLQLIVTDSDAREAIVLRMLDSIDACEDKPLWALGQMHLVAATVRARGERAKLRELGRGVMRLGIVHEHAQKFDASNDIHIVLEFEIRLRDVLQLPVSSVRQNYPPHIPDSYIEAAREQALGVAAADFEAWLAGWPEWRRQLRLEAVVPYAQLDPHTQGVDAQVLAEAVNMKGERVRDPVFALPDTANVWSYADLCANWVRHGMDFGNNVIAAEEFAGQVVRRLSDDVEAASRVSLRESLRRRLSIFHKSVTGSRKSGAATQLAPAIQEDFSR